MKRTQQDELDLMIPKPRTAADAVFADRCLLALGLPVRRPPMHEGWTAVHHRNVGAAQVRVLTPSISDPDTFEPVQVGTPWGAKARLVLIALGRAARRVSDHSPIVEFGHIRDWMTAAGIAVTGDSVDVTKDQLIRLSYSLFDVTQRRPGQSVAVRNEMLIRDPALSLRELRYYRDGRINKVLWPKAVHLTESGLRRLRNDMAEIHPARLREVGPSTTALDMLLHLAHRLPRLSTRAYEVWSWKEMQTLFTAVGKPPEKSELLKALRLVLKAYPEAVIEDHSNGLLLFRSAPADRPVRVIAPGFTTEEAAMREAS